MAEADQIASALDRYAGHNPPLPCWLEDENGHFDGALYCRSCARRKVITEALAPNLLCGGHSREVGADNCCHCEACGVLLDYDLSTYGGEAELEHFSEHMPDRMDTVTAFHIARMVEAIPDDEEALAIGRRAVEMIPAAAAAD